MNQTKDPKKEAADNPGKEDVHEQREPEQPREGVITETEKKPPPQKEEPGR